MSVNRIGSVDAPTSLIPRTASTARRGGEDDYSESEENVRYGNRNHSETPRSETKSVNDSATFRRNATALKAQEGDLVACAGVKLKGTITSCNTLSVEGEVEATIQARQLVVGNGGAFVGKAQVEEADIGGRFEGTLHVAGKLIVRRSGRVIGQITYGQIEVEPGGELRGNISLQVGARRSGGIFGMSGPGRL